ncbi:hypothetical protein NPIL_559871 [Nephila pilipes]|uniref:Uncharacterized protein n=1 Tax=Nephila pilipes TaxID=299642 RepID=A0A8X6MIL6_NEPPI|nr:hypothetical protein NPIL_559871 [Nephila pilipes]
MVHKNRAQENQNKDSEIIKNMPTKREGANLSRDTNKSRSIRNRRAQRTEEQVQEENTGARVRMAQLRQEQLDDTRAERNEVMRLEH